MWEAPPRQRAAVQAAGCIYPPLPTRHCLSCAADASWAGRGRVREGRAALPARASPCASRNAAGAECDARLARCGAEGGREPGGGWARGAACRCFGECVVRPNQRLSVRECSYQDQDAGVVTEFSSWQSAASFRGKTPAAGLRSTPEPTARESALAAAIGRVLRLGIGVLFNAPVLLFSTTPYLLGIVYLVLSSRSLVTRPVARVYRRRHMALSTRARPHPRHLTRHI